MRTTRLSCDRTRAASSLLPATTLKRADALAVERERLGEGTRQEHRLRRLGEQARRVGVRVDAVGEALVGEVEEGHEAARLDDLEHLASTAPGVRSTPVGLWQQECSTTIAPAGSFFSAASMPSKFRPWVFGVVVGVALDREAGAFEQRAMVLPARVADPDRGAGAELLAGNRRRPSGRRCRPAPGR